MRLALLLALSCACADEFNDVTGGWGLDLTWLPGVGKVYECRVQIAPGYTDKVELCWNGEVGDLQDGVADRFGAQFVDCYDTPRHSGVCWFCCGDCGTGANAKNGSWCI